MTDNNPDNPMAAKLRAMLGDITASIGGGEDVSLDNIEPMAVTPETEAAFKDAQKKKADAEADDGGNGGYG